jgi:hypothetical protein
MVNFALPTTTPTPCVINQVTFLPPFISWDCSYLKEARIATFHKSFLIIYSPSSHDLRANSLMDCQRCKINRMLITIHLSRMGLFCCPTCAAEGTVPMLNLAAYIHSLTHLKQTTSPLRELTADSFLVLHFVVSFKAAEDDTYIHAFSLTIPVLCVLLLLNLSKYSTLHSSLTNHFRLLKITFRRQASLVCIGS